MEVRLGSVVGGLCALTGFIRRCNERDVKSVHSVMMNIHATNGF